MFHHLVFDGVSDGSLGIGLDMVGAAGALGQPVRQRVLSWDGKPVRSANGRSVCVDGVFRSQRLREGHVVVIPGITLVTAAQMDAAFSRADICSVAPHLQRAVGRNVTVAASCAGTYVLARAGVLDDRTATTTWWMQGDFAERFPRIRLQVDRMVVCEERVWTAGAAYAHADLMLALLGRRFGDRLAHAVAKTLLLDGRRSQVPYMVGGVSQSADPVVRKLERFVRGNIERQVTVGELAKVAGMSPRTLSRRLQRQLQTTPLRFVQRIRIRRAIRLLEVTTHSIERIAAEVGYADAAAFRRNFRREVGRSPTAHRRS